jgi:Protein of unknown function (DUF3098)
MNDKKQVSVDPASSAAPLFGKQNYIWMLIGLAVVALGLLLMAGGKSDSPAEFDPNKVYSFTRITLAPFLIIAGLCIEVYAIFRKPKN